MNLVPRALLGIPKMLKELLVWYSEISKSFRKHIRTYNNMFVSTSLGIKVNARQICNCIAMRPRMK